jgi:rhodanese-related sulfurtransferase
MPQIRAGGGTLCAGCNAFELEVRDKQGRRQAMNKTATVIAASAVIALLAAYAAIANCGKAGCGAAPCGTGACGDKAASGCAVSAGCAEKTACAAAGVKTETAPAEIDTAALAALLRAKTPVVVLDARSGKYDDGRRIPGAKALAPTATEEAAAKLIPSKDALVVTYCSNLKCPASEALAKRLRELGFGNVLEYRPGIAGWVEAGNAIEQAPKG